MSVNEHNTLNRSGSFSLVPVVAGDTKWLNRKGTKSDEDEYATVKCENHYIDTCGEGQNKRNEKSYTRYVAPN